MAEQDAGQKTMAELYREEVSTLGDALSRDVLRLEALCAQHGEEDGQAVREHLETLLGSLLRSAHSLKGAARVMRFTAVADVTHELEEVLLAGQRAAVLPDRQVVDSLLLATDFINASGSWEPGQNDLEATVRQAQGCVLALRRQAQRLGKGLEFGVDTLPSQPEVLLPDGVADTGRDPVLRVRADLINELLQLGVQGRVLSHRLDQLPQDFLRFSGQHFAVERELDACSAQLAAHGLDTDLRHRLLAPLREQMSRLRALQSDLYEQMSRCVQEQALLSERWYAQVLACRTRPFADIVSGFPRLVRDIGRALDREIVLRIEGAATLADRDIMEKLEMPLIHLLRNACSHGIEPPSERLAAGKPQQGIIMLAVTHNDGWLQVSVRDDGRGIDTDLVRRSLRVQGEPVEGMDEQTLLKHVFTQGFSTAAEADAVSGRGVGLAAVSDRVRRLGGRITVQSERGKGAVFTLHVPVTRALLRVLSLRLFGEPYALPLGRIEGLILISAQEHREGQVQLGGQQVPIIALHQLLYPRQQRQQGNLQAEANRPTLHGGMRMVVLQEAGKRYVLDAGTIEDESELIVHEMDARLGELPLFQSAGLNEKGEVVLVLDVNTLYAEIESQLTGDACVPSQVASGFAGNEADSGSISTRTDSGASKGSVSATAVASGTDASPAAAESATPPVAAESASSFIVTKPDANAADSAQPLRVLLAEDSFLARARIASILEQAGGFELTCVADGLAAWQKLQTQPDHFDLLLTDFEMPRLNGYELAQKVRSAPAALNTLPIVIISAKDVEAVCCCTGESAVNTCLRKSLLDSDPPGFVQTLRTVAEAGGDT